MNDSEENNALSDNKENGNKEKKREQRSIPVTMAIGLMLILCVVTFVITSALYNNRHSADIADAVKAEQDKYESEIATYKSEIAGFSDLIEADSIVKNVYIGELPDESELLGNLMGVYFETLGDKYGYYYSKEEIKKYNEARGDTSYGIGITSFRKYDAEFDGIYVTHVIEGSPAEKAGLVEGDIIIAVDGTKITEENFNDCFDGIKGEIDTSVTLRVKRSAGDIKDITVVRGTYKNKTVYYKKYNADTAYIEITNFYDKTDEEFKEIIEKAKADGAVKYVFDVRGNGGGGLDTVLNMLDLILPEGPLIRIVDKDGKETVHNSDAENQLDAQMAVIVNGGTASAAELFASAIRDYNKGKLVGTKTYGKGSMQSMKYLKSGAAIKVTDNKYLPPYGESYDGVGITPDVTVELTEEQQKTFYKLKLEDDPQMLAALDSFDNK